MEFRALQQCRGLPSLGIEVLQHHNRLGHRILALFGFLDRCLILGLLLLPETGRLGLGVLKLGQLTGQAGDLLSQLADVSLQLIDLCLQTAHGIGLLLACGFVRRHFCIAPTLFGRLLLGLVLESHNQLLDHLLDLPHWVCSCAFRKRGEKPAVQTRRLPLQETSHLGLRRVRRVGSQLRQGRGRLHRLREAGSGDLGDYLDGFVQRNELLSTKLLPLFEVPCLLLAGGRQISQVLLVHFEAGLGLGQPAGSFCLVLKLLCLRGMLLLLLLRRLSNLCRDTLKQKLESVLLGHLFLFELQTFVHKLLFELL
mmetsp:Transcript_27710/g.65122  ORF Transcript_27710/g.65122 Transcript_27710/m.65122 type:complete len:311 (+) Transcript_27710:489-1421(+)